MAEDTQFEALMKKILESPPEVVGAPPVVEQEVAPVVEEDALGLSSLLGGVKEKAGDLFEWYKRFSYPEFPDQKEDVLSKRVVGEQLEVIPSMMDIIYKKETGSFPDPFIRTEVEGTGTDAFGPAQLRKGILEDLLESNLTEDERKLTDKLIEQSNEFDRFNRGDIEDPSFGPGGKGFGFNDNEKRIYRNLAEKGLLIKAAQRGYDINNLSSEQTRSLIGDWYSRSEEPERRKKRLSYIESAIDMAPMKALVGTGIIEPPPKKPTKRKRTGGMISRNPYPHNPRPI